MFATRLQKRLPEPTSSSLYVVGLNHRTAPVAIREEVAFDATQLPTALNELNRLEAVRGAVILSTCNRTELYCDVDDAAADKVADWLATHRGLSASARSALYMLEGNAAIRHVFAVACGLDSMVLGEPQILGQAKQAYATARELGHAGPLLNLLFQQAFAVAKHVRTNTQIGASPVSVASTAVMLAKQLFARLGDHTALLLGAGETIELAARHLHGNGVGRMIIANRRVERARGLALQFDAYAISLAEIPAHLAEADIVLASTASPRPLIDEGMVEEVLARRRRKPVFMVDLAMPRDIAPEVARFEDVYLYTLDDLNEMIVRNRETRAEAADAARDIVAEAATGFERLLATRDTVPLIRELRNAAGRMRDHSLEEARQLLAAGREPREVLELLSQRLTARLLHEPTKRLRQAGAETDVALARAAAELFGLDNSGDDDRD